MLFSSFLFFVFRRFLRPFIFMFVVCRFLSFYFVSVEVAAAVVRPRVHGERRIQGVLQVRLPVFERGDAPHDRERCRHAASADGEPKDW